MHKHRSFELSLNSLIFRVCKFSTKEELLTRTASSFQFGKLLLPQFFNRGKDLLSFNKMRVRCWKLRRYGEVLQEIVARDHQTELI